MGTRLGETLSQFLDIQRHRFSCSLSAVGSYDRTPYSKHGSNSDPLPEVG